MTPADASWVAPAASQQGLMRFVRLLRERAWLIALVVLATLAAAAAYLATAERTYDASADILVTPVNNQNELAFGLAVIRESNDPTRDVSTAARLVENTDVAVRVKRRLRRPETPEELLGLVNVVPVAQSSVVTVTASDTSARSAAELADAFAAEAVRVQTERFHRQVDEIIKALRRRIGDIGPDGLSQTDLVQRVSRYVALRSGPDPTLAVTTDARPPQSPSSPRTRMTLVAALLAGLVLGLGAALATEAFDPRLRREEQLRDLFGLPILARVPHQKVKRRQWLLPERVSGGTLEAFRTLRAVLAINHPDEPGRGRSVLITGAGAGEGKSTTAMNFAYALSRTGRSVILLEADVYRPTLATALGIEPTLGTESVLLRTATVQEALVETERYGPDLRFLLAGGPGSAAGDPLSLPTVPELTRAAEELADYVVIDCPPLTDVSDVLPIAARAEDVLIVVHLGKTRLQRLRELGELLQHNRVRPAGVVVVGVRERDDSGYYYRGDVDGPAARPAAASDAETREAPAPH